jgi:O-methyltransferase
MKPVVKIITFLLCAVGVVCAILGAFFVMMLVNEAGDIESYKQQMNNTIAAAPPAPDPGKTLQERYLNLLKRYLTRYDCDECLKVKSPLDDFLTRHQLMLALIVPAEKVRGLRADGHDAPAHAETMVGLRRLDNIEFCIRDILNRNVPGDLLEAGAWRGGATIFMRAVLKTYGDNTRTVWVSDSFEGLPKADKAYQFDVLHNTWRPGSMAVSLEEVKDNFARYGLLDDHVKFLKGWFKDALPKAPIKQLALLRVDGDLYESTTEALEIMYDKVSPGGWVIDDDYGAVPNAKKAVEDFRAKHHITAELKHIDWTGVYWQKPI